MSSWHKAWGDTENRIAARADDDRRVLARDDTTRSAEMRPRHAAEIFAKGLHDRPRAGQRRKIEQIVVATVAEARPLDRNEKQVFANVVEEQTGERGFLEILCDDEEMVPRSSRTISSVGMKLWKNR